LANSLTIENSVDAGYGAVRVLEDVSLDVRAGETVVLLGTNGNGKSTLMKCVMGMVRPSAGSIVAEIDGERTIWSAARPRRSSISASRWCRKAAGCFRS
jgi:branched-chain amino acid transport system ATP-binding protein